MSTPRSFSQICRLFAFAGLLAVALAAPLRAEDPVSSRTFPPVALANHFACVNPQDDRDLGSAFLLKYRGEIYAVSAKHILPALKIDGLNRLTLAGTIREWTMFSKEDRTQRVTLGRMLNQNPNEKLGGRNLYRQDWVVFEIVRNTAKVQPLELRPTAPAAGEKLYTVGWTNHQPDGAQRVYEWEYFKTVGTHLLMKPVVVPALLGGLSGAPVLDAQGRLVGIVSNGTPDPSDGKKYFSPCSLSGLAEFLDRQTPAGAK